jgi:acetyl esterase/lipase
MTIRAGRAFAWSARVVLAAALAAVASAAQDTGPPPVREQRALVEEYLGLDPLVADQRARQLAILARLEAVPPLKPAKLREWRKRIDKLLAKGPVLPKAPGTYHLWDDLAPRGKFIVGGRTKSPTALFIGLHGGGVGSGDADGAAGQYSGACEELGWVGIFPEVLEKTEHGWTTSGTEEFVLELIDRARRTWKIDPDQVFLGGHSMGGYGTWALGGHHPDRFAGLAPSAGGPSPVFSASGQVISIMKGVVPNLRNVRMVVFQSDDDPKVPPGPNRYAAKEVERARQRWGGFDFEYWEVTGRGHGTPEGGSVVHLRKIADRVRDARPTKLVWEPELPWKRRFYWLHWETPERHAIVEAERDPERGEVAVTTLADTTGMSLLLDDGVLDLSRPIIVRVNEDIVWSGRPKARLTTLLATSQADDARYRFAYSVPLSR